MRALLIVLACAGAALPRLDGEIALTDSPFCEFFVVRTARGYSTMHWRGGHYVFSEGDRIGGPLETPGLQQIELAGAGPVRVRIEAVRLGLTEARAAYYRRCRFEGAAPPDDA